MIKKAILNNWKTDIIGYAQSIAVLEDMGYPAWTVRFIESYGVALPYAGDEDINESFANAKIQSTSISFKDGTSKRAIVLITGTDNTEDLFASLCEALLDPGENGENRKSIEASPVIWWQQWKELLGNKNIDERIYDTLGELCVLYHSVKNGTDAQWNGPERASYDIETEEQFLEVKSTINREKTEVTISSQFQLFPKDKPLSLVFCRFEPVILSGISIDSLIDDFELLGYNTDILNTKLAKVGFEKGMSARKKKFLLHEMLQFSINDSFPRITPASFVGGVMPEGITKVTYTVDLSGLTPVSLIQDVNDGI